MIICGDCKRETKDYYMIKFNLWLKYGNGDGHLCIECLEKRMGRRLTKRDFLDCPLNLLDEFPQIERTQVHIERLLS